MKIREFLIVAMVSAATCATIWEVCTSASWVGASTSTRIGAGSSPSDRHSSLVQLSALAPPSSPPAQPEGLAGSKSKQGASPSATKSKNVAPAKSGARLTKDQLRAEVRKALPKLPSKEVDAAVWIIWKESTGRLYARNPRSTSHGLNGFLRGTWRNVTSRSGIRHGYDPKTQILAMQHYAYGRYGSFTAAKAHHVRKGWY